MTWKGSGGDPWSADRPPDFKEAFDKIRKSFKIPSSFSFSPRGGLIPFIVIAAVVVWLASGIYFVAPDELGVIKRFGKAVRVTEAGPHYHLPTPIETVLKPKVTQVRRVEVGFRTLGDRQIGPNKVIPSESLMLTKSENIINLSFIVQYKINDAMKYLFNVKDQEKTIKDAAEAAMRETVGENEIDDTLTTGKFKVQQDTKDRLQSILDGYQSGIFIVAVQLQDVHPPDQVMTAFKDVASAKEDKSRMINEAYGYSNEIIPKAKGMAAKILNEALAYREAKIIRAQGDASRFNQILAEYSRAKDITKKRLYIETMEEVLPSATKIIIDERAGRNILPYLPLGERTPEIRTKEETKR
ncbi:MAG: FtsH protease activity modulator HflK [Deltaproteobacteria bacterium]|nr:FtsH protease activity modulator HflK [Deltaproteobacteria bacterium]